MTSQLSKLKEYIVGYITFPAINHFYNRRNILSQYYRLIQIERESREIIREIQTLKLRRLIEYAYNWIPYYRIKFSDMDFSPNDVKQPEDIRHIPPLERYEVIEHYHDLVDHRLAKAVDFADQKNRQPGIPLSWAFCRKYNLVRNTSSGSTGVPVAFFENGSKTALSWTHELRIKNWHGLPIGASEARLARVSSDFFAQKKSPDFRKHLWNQLILPGTNLSPAVHAINLDRLIKFQPRIIWGYTSSLAGLAEHIIKNKADLKMLRPEMIISWAAPLYDGQRDIIKHAFNCSITNIYGARETGHISALCPENAHHIFEESVLVEIVETDAMKYSDGSGEIFVTELDCSPMPFIRYRMGDLGQFSVKPCRCGRTLRTFEKILGRTGEVYTTQDGRMIAPNFWCRFFMSNEMRGVVKQFQIEYLSDRMFFIKIVKGDLYNKDAENYIQENLNKNFDMELMTINIKYVSKIEPLISGKYEFVVNRINQK